VNSMRELAGLPAEAQEIISSAQQKLTRLLIKNIEAEEPRLDASIIADVVLTFFHGFCIAQNLKSGKASSERKIRNLMQVVRNL
jgi:TetR/AcrR family transcriptional regulator, copper-responsive repressor